MDGIIFDAVSDDLNEYDNFEVVDFVGEDIIPELETQVGVSDPVYDIPIESEPEEVIYIPQEVANDNFTQTDQQASSFEVVDYNQDNIPEQQNIFTQETIPVIVETTTEITTLETVSYDSDILNKISDQLQVLVEASNDETELTTEENSNIITLEESTTEATTEYNIDDIYRSLSDINENIVYIGQQNERTEETITNFLTGVLGVLLVGVGCFVAYAAFSKIYG